MKEDIDWNGAEKRGQKNELSLSIFRKMVFHT